MKTSHELTVWRIWLPELSRFEEVYFSTLNKEEKERALTFVTSNLRRKYILSHGILRQILASYLSIDPRDIEYQRGPYNKPQIVDNLKGLEFNMSHASEMALVGISFEAPVGIDVEECRPGPEALLQKSVFSKKEQATYNELRNGQKMEAFFTAWTHKEALIKLDGIGLFKDLTEVEVPLYLLGQPTPVLYERSHKYLQSFIPRPNYIAAVASSKPGFKLSVRDLESSGLT